MDIAIIRFDAPLISFGGTLVDQHGITDRFPGTSFFTGLFGNSLGLSHCDSESLSTLQARIQFAARWDIPPELIIDYHTVDLGSEKMKEPGWTTRGEPEHRAGGLAAFGTHQRYRHYLANGIMTAAISLLGKDNPTISELAEALRRPARPLFIGRKVCIPATHILLKVIDSVDVLTALKSVPPAERFGKDIPTSMEACWPAHFGHSKNARIVRIYDKRDWRNQVHTGISERVEGLIEVKI